MLSLWYTIIANKTTTIVLLLLLATTITFPAAIETTAVAATMMALAVAYIFILSIQLIFLCIYF